MSKQLSPLRYPGGKAQLEAFFRSLLSIQKIDNITYVEPFAGGAGLALSLLFSNHVQKIIINDFDRAIYSVWYSILNFTNEFISKLENTQITIDEWHVQKEIYKNANDNSLFDLGFATFFLNRTNHSGILKGGVIGGKNQNGNFKLDCRFNKKALIMKIEEISKHKDNIEVHNLDVIKFIDEVISHEKIENTFIFFDPPYFQKGKDLYTNFFVYEDHHNLSQEIIKKLNDHLWVTTYDECPEIKELYKQSNGYVYSLNYCLSQKKQARELMYFSNKISDLELIVDNQLSFANRINSKENSISI